MESDAQLVERCLAGEQPAFAELVRRYRHPVYNLAYRMTGNHADAADVAQEAFVRAYRRLHQYRAEYAFRNWMLTICANLARNRLRSLWRRRRAEEAHVDLQALAAPAGADPRRASLEGALAALSPRLRAPVVLRYAEGLSYEEIAATLHIGLSAAKMRVKRAREELARRMAAPESMRPPEHGSAEVLQHET